MKEDELLEVLRRQNPKAIVFDEDFIEKITKIKDQIKSIEHYIVVGEKEAPEGMIRYEDLISRSSNKMPEKLGATMAFSYFTGGTTGIPKHVSFSDIWGYLFSNIAEPPTEKLSGKLVPFKEYLIYYIKGFATTSWYDSFIHTDEKTRNIRSLVSTPLYHAATNVAWSTAFTLCGATMVTMKKFDPEEFLRIVEKERISHALVVPTILERILALPDDIKRKYDLSSMYAVVSAGAPCPPKVKRGTNELFIRQKGRPVYSEYFASTESAASDVLAPMDYLENPKRIDSAGKAGRGMDTVVLDEETGKLCPPGKEGIICDRSIGTISSKLLYGGVSEEATKKAYHVIDGKEYFDEGVIGYIDKDGYIYLTGRKKEIIIPGGVNIYPDEIEVAIMGDSRVRDVAVIPIPDKDLGEVVGVVVQLEEGESCTEKEIIERCKKEGLYGYKIPKKVDFWKELPREVETGKMLKRDIIPKYWEDKGIKRRG
jgi:long-chain acyl-CoA synthetase